MLALRIGTVKNSKNFLRVDRLARVMSGELRKNLQKQGRRCRFQLKRRLTTDEFLLGVYDLIEKGFFS